VRAAPDAARSYAIVRCHLEDSRPRVLTTVKVGRGVLVQDPPLALLQTEMPSGICASDRLQSSPRGTIPVLQVYEVTYSEYDIAGICRSGHAMQAIAPWTGDVLRPRVASKIAACDLKQESRCSLTITRRNNMKTVGRLMATVMLSLGLLNAALADEPRTLAWKILEGAAEGIAAAGDTPGGDSSVLIGLSNPYVGLRNPEFNINSPILVVFEGCAEDPATAGKPVANLESLLSGRATSPEYFTDKPFDPSAMWRICAAESGAVILPTAGANIKVNVDFLRIVLQGVHPTLRAGVYVVDARTFKLTGGDLGELIGRYRGKQPDATLNIDLYYRLSRNATGGFNWLRGSYADVFGDPGTPKAQKRGVTGDYEKSASLLPVNLQAYRRKLSIPAEVKDDGGILFKRTLEQVLAQGSSNAEDVCAAPAVQAAPEQTPSPAFATTDYSISGRFSAKWTTDHTLHPGFGFKVELFGLRDFLGFPINGLLGTAWVESNGAWTVNIPASVGYLGGALTVHYLSYNEYYAPMNQAQAKYWWTDPAWTIPAGVTTFNVGHRFADTDGGTYNGVGELVDSAMTMWSRLYWDAGVNPVAAAPIKFFFPNTWDDCGDGSGNPWSCATGDGTQIWLIASHGTQGDVVNHEMGHALNSKYWGGKRPANTGGSHNLNTCYSTRLGMTLFEGFANYMAAWVGYPDRNGADGSFNSGRWALGWDAEQRTSGPTCTNGWENEVWVARTFWDLHDKHADGDDILWFIHPGAVISLYLSNGVVNNGDARDMRFYENIYRNAASAGHQQFISDIFNQNRM
jgi:hypothetical protein